MASPALAAYGMGMKNADDLKIAVVIVAAGRGERAGKADGPKQYRRVGGEPIIARTLRAFAEHPAIGHIIVAIHADDAGLYSEAAGKFAAQTQTVIGGATRQASTLAALQALGSFAPEAVLIHDAARPFIDAALIDRAIGALQKADGVLPAMPVTDTLKSGLDGCVTGTVDRRHLYAAQTPQAFRFDRILDAHQRAAKESETEFTDDASIAEWAGIKVALVEGSPDNIKITYARDIELANQQFDRFPDVRTGNGYDVHSFEPGDHVTLCGVAIPHNKKLNGHSDADVALHALTDALLATIGAGDIGTHFPPSDPQWRGAASRIFVEHAVKLVRARSGRIANADITLIAEAPKVGPHREAMTRALTDMLGISSNRVSIKATTNEKMGFVGREEGIAAIATTSVVYPGELPE